MPADLPAAVLRHFLRDIENHLLTESLPEARESLGDWILRSQKNSELTEAAEKDSRRIDGLLHDKTLQRREERIPASPQESLLIQAIRQDKALVRRSEEEQQQLDATLSQAAALRVECDRQLAELSRRAQLLERKKQAILGRITVKFYGYSRTRRELLRPYAKDFASEEVRRQFAQQIGDRICPEASLESRAATRAAEIIRLAKRHGIDDERVTNWISGGISLDAISAEILDELASRSAQPATSAETETPAPRTDGNQSGLYDHELAEVFRLGIRGRVGRAQIADSIEKYWTPELTAAEFIAGVSGLRRLKARTSKRSIVREIFELFGEPDRAWEWKDAYVQRLLSDLEQLAEGATVKLEPAIAPGPPADPPGSKIPEVPNPDEKIAEPSPAATAAAELVTDNTPETTRELEPAATPEKPAVESEEESEPPASWTSKESGTWSPETEERLATLAAAIDPGAEPTPDPPADPAAKIAAPLSERLKSGKDCEEMAEEIRKIRTEAIANGKAMFEIREAYPDFRVWKAAERLLPEDRAVFEAPTRWGAAGGYANRFLSKLYIPAKPATVNDWRKEFRAHKRQNQT